MPALESRDQEQDLAVDPSRQRSSLPPSTNDKGPTGTPSSSAGSLARKLGVVVLVLAAGGFGYWKLQGNKQQAADSAQKTQQAANRPIPVTVAPIVAKTMPIYLTALGTVTAYNTVTIKTRVDGQLLSVNVREGQQVRQGQVLAQIDPSPYMAAQAQAEGQLAKDQASADYAKAEAGRYNSLYEAGVVSKDSQQVQQSTAGQSVGVLAADRAAIQAAKVNVAYTRITSPINGVVGLRQVDAGNIVHAADATGLLVVTQLQPIAVIFTLPEDQLPIVRRTMLMGKPLVVEAYDRSDASLLATGKLLTLDNEIDTTTGTLKAKAVFDNKDGALFPNQFVNVRLVLEQRQNSLVMPATALQSGANGSFVYMLKDGMPPKSSSDDASAASGSKGAPKAAAGPKGAPADAAAPKLPPHYVTVQNVEVDLTEGTQIILKSGLNPGDQVVVDGQEKLKNNARVTPVTAQPRGRGGRGGGAGAGAPAGAVNSVDPQAAPIGRRDGKAAGNAAGEAAVGRDERPTTPSGAGGHHHQNPGAPQ